MYSCDLQHGRSPERSPPQPPGDSMSATSEQETTDETGALRGGALGGVGIVFFVVAAAAPLAAVTGTSPIVFQGVAIGAPGMFLMAGLVCLLFAVGYAAVSRHI